MNTHNRLAALTVKQAENTANLIHPYAQFQVWLQAANIAREFATLIQAVYDGKVAVEAAYAIVLETVDYNMALKVAKQ